MRNNYQVIDIEHHFCTRYMMEEYVKLIGEEAFKTIASGYSLEEWFEKEAPVLNLDEARIKVMDKSGVDFVQVSLTTPGPEAFPVETAKKIARQYNDTVAKAIKEHPDRFGAWMSLVPEDPEWSVKEIDRAAKMGLFGWSCLSNMNGKYIDDPKYWPIFKRLEELNMPIYLHPTFVTWKEYTEFGYCIAGPSLGFTADTQLCLMRMIHRGVFDKFPNLKVILGHDGEAFAFLKNRIDTAYRQGCLKPNIGDGMKYAPSYYLEHNVWMTTSGNYLYEALRCSLDVMEDDKMMLGTDYAYEDFEEMIAFIADNPKLSDSEKQRILNGNAIKLGFGPKKSATDLENSEKKTYRTQMLWFVPVPKSV